MVINEINAIVYLGDTKPWINVLKTLKIKLGINPSYIVAKDDNPKHIFPDTYYHNGIEARKGKGFPKLKKKPIDEKLLNLIAYEELIFLKMQDRLDPYGDKFTLTNRQYFFRDLLAIWLTIIEKYNIKLILFHQVPHMNCDYALYVASKILNIEIITFQITPFGDSTFIIDSIEQTPKYLKEYMNGSTLRYEKNIHLRNDIKEKIDKVLSNYENAKPEYMIKQEEALSNEYSIHDCKKILFKTYSNLKNIKFLFKDEDTYFISKGLMPCDSKISKLKLAIYKKEWRRYKRNLKNYYLNICDKSELIDKKYIFLALHYQPEETSCPTGGRFADQLLIVELLDSFLDKNIQIVVKEHKSQFHPNMKGEAGRNIYFYKRLQRLSSRIKFVHIDEDPFELIDGAIATITISGTIGWESVIRGTPTIIFGRAWYEDMPGVYKVKSYNDLEKHWKNITENGYIVDHKKVVSYFLILQNYLIRAPLTGPSMDKSNIDINEASYNICDGIKNHLLNKGWDI